MKKIVLICFSIIFLLAGCSNQSLEQLAMQSEFSVVFDTLNTEEDYANFTVNGYPNQEEFEQIPIIINDSLNEQNINEPITVNVYSNVQSKDEDPYYGSTNFENNEIDSAKLVNISMEQYLNKSDV